MELTRDSVHYRAGLNVAAQLLEQLLRDPAVAFGPRERSFFFGVARCEIVDAGPGGGVTGQRAVVVTAGVVDVPTKRGGVEAFADQPIRHRDTVQRRWLGAALH